MHLINISLEAVLERRVYFTNDLKTSLAAVGVYQKEEACQKAPAAIFGEKQMEDFECWIIARGVEDIFVLNFCRDGGASVHSKRLSAVLSI